MSKMYMKESINSSMSMTGVYGFLFQGEAAEEMCKEKK